MITYHQDYSQSLLNVNHHNCNGKILISISVTRATNCVCVCGRLFCCFLLHSNLNKRRGENAIRSAAVMIEMNVCVSVSGSVNLRKLFNQLFKLNLINQSIDFLLIDQPIN